MASIKRLLRETSYKILGKMGACHGSGSHSLNNPTQLDTSQHIESSLITRSSGKKRTTKIQRKPKSKSKNKHLPAPASAIPEALLIASKNYLPPVQFHHVHGPNVQLHKNKFVARRTQSFCQALVFSNRVILPNERVYIKVLEIAKGWSGTIRFGFTSVDPATLRYQMPKHACPDMTNAGHTWARALADEVIKRNSVVHFSYNTNGLIHYGINNQDCGIFHANVNTSQNLWFIVDIYGLTAAVELIDPRIHNATSDLDMSLDASGDDQDGMLLRASTMFKSTSAMDELLSQHLALRAAAKKKRSRKHQTQAAGHQPEQLLYHENPYLPEGVMLPAGSFARFHPAAASQQGRPLLPNLSSVLLPPVQQNIYSPMPMINNRPDRHHHQQQQRRQQHDYYQILANSRADHHNSSLISSTSTSQSQDNDYYSPARMPTAGLHGIAQTPTKVPSIGTSSQQQTEATNQSKVGRRAARKARTSTVAAADDASAEICQQLSGLQIHQSDTSNGSSSNASGSGSSNRNASVNSKQQYGAAAKSAHHPVAAARRRLQSSFEPNQKTSPHQHSSNANQTSAPSTATATTAAAAAACASGASIKAKARQSVKSAHLKPTASKDNSDKNNNPQSKDCPICFERPINCVLYQCGHMCTCYECGVKQWRTQQRTCPICRTIIKDVIKTYMS